MFMNKKLIAAGLAALALMATAAAASAAPAVASTNVNVRSGPGPGYRAIDTLRRGDRVDIQYCQGSWCFVEKSGPDGWVSASYLERGGRPGRPDWDDGPGRPGWGNGPGRPDWGYPPRPPRPPHWGGNGPGWGNNGPGWGNPRPPRPGSSVCFNGPNGYFCVGD